MKKILCLVFVMVLSIIFFNTNDITHKALLKKSKNKIQAFPPDYEKKRILITTDIGGGDPDDIQSMIHFLVYSNMFDLEGVVVGRPKGNISQMIEVISAYKKDYRKFLKVSPDYITPRQLRRLSKVGNKSPQPPQGFSSPTPGSRLIVRAARKDDPRPLHILVWGSTTDVAQAISNTPDIRKKIRIFNIGLKGYNYDGDRNATNYIRTFNDIQIIEAGDTIRGIYGTGLNDKTKYGNVGFVDRVIKKRGALGRLFHSKSATINVNRYGIKMGDTPSLFFTMNGDWNNPKRPSWGGRYCRVGKNRFIDCKKSSWKIGNWDGALTVAEHRKSYLNDWEQRLKWIYD